VITTKRANAGAIILALIASFLLPVSVASATISNVYSCNTGDTNGGGSLATCTHTVTYNATVSYSTPTSSSIYSLPSNWYLGFASSSVAVVVSSSSTSAMYSTNGTTWTASTRAVSGAPLNGVACNGSYLIVYSGNSYDYSTDGHTWSSKNLPTSVIPDNVNCLNGSFVVTTSSFTKYYVSTDGINWTSYNAPDSATYTGASYFNGTYELFNNASHVWYSSSLTSGWTVSASGMTASASYFASSSSLTISCSASSCYKSSDGSTWSAVSTVTSDIGLAYGDGYFYFNAYGSTSLTQYYYNGTSLTSYDSGTYFLGGFYFNHHFYYGKTGVATVYSVLGATIYSCTSGDTLSGTTCTNTTTYSGTLIITSPITVSTTYTCPSGYVASGSGTSTICTTTNTNYPATKTYSCTTGTLFATNSDPSGYQCLISGSTVAATVTTSFSCLSGDTLSGSTCNTTASSIPATLTNNYTCPNGGTPSGSTCIISATSYPATATTTYTCPSGGGDLYGHPTSGTTCITAGVTTPTAVVTTTYTCPNGGTVSSGPYYTCQVAPPPNYAPKVVNTYLCTGVSFYNATTCYYDGSTFPAQIVSSYTCPNGGTLSSGPYYSCVFPSYYNDYSPTASIVGTCSVGVYIGGISCETPSTSYTATSTTTYACSTLTDTLSGSTCSRSSSSYTATVIQTLSCANSSATLFGGNCILSGNTYPEISTATYTCSSSYAKLLGTSCVIPDTYVAAVYTLGCLSGDTLSGSICTVVNTTTSYILLYSGVCQTNFKLDTSTGACNLVTGGVSSTTVGTYICYLVASSTSATVVFNSNYDATSADGLGSYTTCQLSALASVVGTGVYICTSQDYNSLTSFVYTATSDLTSTSGNAYIWCVYSGDAPYDPTADTAYVYTIPTSTDVDPCASVVGDFSDYLTCIGSLT